MKVDLGELGALLRLASRNIVRQRVRSLLTLIAIALGVAGIVLAGGFVEDVYVQLGEATIHSQVGHLQVSKRGYVERGIQRPLAFLIDNPDRTAREIQKTVDPREILFRLNFSGLLSNGKSDFAVRVEAGDADGEARLASYLRTLSGRTLSASDRLGVYVGEGVAATLKLKPGDSVTLVVNTAAGGLNSVDLEVTGVFRSFSKDYDARTVRMNVDAARQLLDTTGVNSIVVLLKSTDATSVAAARLRERLNGQDLAVKTWVELSDFYAKTVALFQRQFGFLQLVILVMIVLCVLNSVNLSLYERRSEFGTMRALGSRNGRVFRLIIVEAAVVGFIGAGVGLVAGVVVALFISAIGIPMPPPPNAESGYLAMIRIVPAILASAFLIGVCASIVAAIVPGMRWSRTSIVDALRASV